MNVLESSLLSMTRREFFSRSAGGIGTLALSSLLGRSLSAATGGGLLHQPHFAPKAKRVIYLFMHGGPSQLDMFDHKPGLRAMHGQDLPPSVRGTTSYKTVRPFASVPTICTSEDVPIEPLIGDVAASASVDEGAE